MGYISQITYCQALWVYTPGLHPGFRHGLWRFGPTGRSGRRYHILNTPRPRKNGHLFPDDIFKWIFLMKIYELRLKISLKFVRRGLINNLPALVQIMAWRWPSAKPLHIFHAIMLVTPCLLTRIREFIHTQHRNTTRGRRPSVVLRC